MAQRIQSLVLPGPAGRLEALFEEPAHAPLAACLVCHPHPLGGGTMHNKVVYRIAKALRRSGAAVLRFNFRGVGLSEGSFDKGRGELDDAAAALAWLRKRYPELPNTLAGFSFGSRIVLRLGCAGGVRQIIAAGLPGQYHAELSELLAQCTIPKAFIHSTQDQYAPVAQMEALYAQTVPPKQLIWVESKDHFFAGALERLEDAVLGLASS